MSIHREHFHWFSDFYNLSGWDFINIVSVPRTDNLKKSVSLLRFQFLETKYLRNLPSPEISLCLYSRMTYISQYYKIVSVFCFSVITSQKLWLNYVYLYFDFRRPPPYICRRKDGGYRWRPCLHLYLACTGLDIQVWKSNKLNKFITLKVLEII
jgi:hypothetical protein